MSCPPIPVAMEPFDVSGSWLGLSSFKRDPRGQEGKEENGSGRFEHGQSNPRLSLKAGNSQSAALAKERNPFGEQPT